MVNIGQKLSPEKLAFSRDFSRDLGFLCVLFGYSRKPGRLHIFGEVSDTSRVSCFLEPHSSYGIAGVDPGIVRRGKCIVSFTTPTPHCLFLLYLPVLVLRGRS